MGMERCFNADAGSPKEKHFRPPRQTLAFSLAAAVSGPVVPVHTRTLFLQDEGRENKSRERKEGAVGFRSPMILKLLFLWVFWAMMILA